MTTTTTSTTTNTAPREAMSQAGDQPIHAPSLAIVMRDSNAHALVWIQIAKPGSFRGHAAGAFEMNAQTFAEIIRNANSRAIPIDFEHASEQPATHGSIPVLGAPAQGWITKLEIRSDGLWGLTQWGDLAKKYIRAGQYKFLSPAIVFGAKDRVTGQPIGARLSSVALTNNPFLDGMAPVTAKDATKGPTPAAAGAPTSTLAPLAPDGTAHPDTTHPTSTPGPVATLPDPPKLIEADDDGDETEMSEPAACASCDELAAKCTALTTENEELRAKLAVYDERELAAMVANAKVWGAPQAESVLMSLARSNKEAFAEAWPMIPANQAHLARSIATGPGRRDAPPDIEVRTVAMRNATPPLPEIDDFVQAIEAEAKAKGIVKSREVVFIEAHERRIDAAARLRREAGFGG